MLFTNSVIPSRFSIHESKLTHASLNRGCFKLRSSYLMFTKRTHTKKLHLEIHKGLLFALSYCLGDYLNSSSLVPLPFSAFLGFLYHHCWIKVPGSFLKGGELELTVGPGTQTLPVRSSVVSIEYINWWNMLLLLVLDNSFHTPESVQCLLSCQYVILNIISATSLEVKRLSPVTKPE